VEDQLRKEIVRLVDIGVLEEDYSPEWPSFSPTFAISKEKGSETKRCVTAFKKNRTQLIFVTLAIPYSKHWEE
jgi:hypothetical protein